MDEQNNKENSSQSAINPILTKHQTTIVRLLSMAISFIISILNYFMSITLKKITKAEKHDSQTTFDSSYAWKTAYSNFFNSCILMTLYQYLFRSPRWYLWQEGGLISDAWFVLMYDTVMVAFMYLVSPWWCYVFYKRWSTAKSIKKTKLVQEELHALYRGVEMHPAFAYATLNKVFFNSMFFLPILPLSAFSTMIAMVLIYWVQKILLLRRYARPRNLSSKIAFDSFDRLKSGVIILVVRINLTLLDIEPHL
jgi:hypothetical protein